MLVILNHKAKHFTIYTLYMETLFHILNSFPTTFPVPQTECICTFGGLRDILILVFDDNEIHAEYRKNIQQGAGNSYEKSVGQNERTVS